MFRNHLEQLCKELDVAFVKKTEKGAYPFRLSRDVEVALRDLDPGVAMQAVICPCPKEKKEALFIFLMRANLLGQGTGGSRIGIDSEEKSLTLSLGLPYEMDYKIFKDALEDFVNHLTYWREMVAKWISETSIY